MRQSPVLGPRVLAVGAEHDAGGELAVDLVRLVVLATWARNGQRIGDDWRRGRSRIIVHSHTVAPYFALHKLCKAAK